MKAPDDVKTPEQYLAQVPEGRREDLTRLHKLICKTVPKLKPTICYGMTGCYFGQILAGIPQADESRDFQSG